VKLVAGKPIGCPKRRDALAQRTLLASEPLGFRFAGPKPEQNRLTNAETDVSRWAAIIRARR
jgi:hypothetical protein